MLFSIFRGRLVLFPVILDQLPICACDKLLKMCYQRRFRDFVLFCAVVKCVKFFNQINHDDGFICTDVFSFTVSLIIDCNRELLSSEKALKQ